MRFRPSVKLTALLAVLALVFLRLGLWQIERKAQKEMLFERFEEAPALGVEQALATDERFARIEAFGHYDVERHILLDNRILDGRVGVHVLTPFVLADGRALLVNRGWLPLPADRVELPEVPTPGSPRTIRGRLNVLPTEGFRLGSADALRNDRWPQLVTYLDPERVEAAVDRELRPWLIQLDAADPTGFGGRRWKAAVMEPPVHLAYAVQWLSLSAAAIIVWIVLGLRRGRIIHEARTRAVGENDSGNGSR